MALAKMADRWDRVAHMNAARDRKAATGGRTYRRPVARKATPDKASWERLAMSVRYAWDCHSGLAIEDYMRAVYPERYDVDALTLGAWS